MFYKFNAHRVAKADSEKDSTAARRIFQKLTALQRRWAGLMSTGAGKLTSKGLKAVCIMLFLAGSVFCGRLIVQGLMHSGKSKIHGGAGVIRNFADEIQKRQRAEYQIKMYLDSLEKAVVEDSLNQLNQIKK
ncbi:hypothetical protein DSL64_15355 [Dyadobacter luteus]|uniref:Uncharacterized protein n=1 Tax=Dyadobacter luteus TaxID=2259619 RepID=A0A3D8Y981_9BACT|nr:hypothetical protein [Dyadobacter luteus]REA60059.1 hypothetical protein DSL64_15355 [Dyadobacter luteus]